MKQMWPDAGSICRDSLTLVIHLSGLILSSHLQGLCSAEQDTVELAGNGVGLFSLPLCYHLEEQLGRRRIVCSLVAVSETCLRMEIEFEDQDVVGTENAKFLV